MTGARILVVDDNEQVRDFMAETVLRPEGYTVDVAEKGLEGLAAALTNGPDLIVTDLALPDLDGLKMVQQLRERGCFIPAILMTAEGSEETAVQALRLGVMDYFIKPFDPEEMLRSIDRVLQSGGPFIVPTPSPEEQAQRRWDTLTAVGKSITALLDLDEILTRVVQAAVYLARAEEGVLMLVDPPSGELYVHAEKNLTNGLRKMRLRVDDSLAGQVIRSGEPLLIAGEGMQQIKTRYLVRSLLYVPLKIKSRTFGVLGVHNRLIARQLTGEDLDVMTALGDYAAIAIVNARLYTTVEKERARLASIIDRVADAILAVDASGRIVLHNREALTFLDALEEGRDPTGLSLCEATGLESLLALYSTAPGGEPALGDVQLADGRVFNAQVMSVPDIGRVGVLHDVTYLKERNRTKAELIEMLAHQVRSPLTAILSYIDLLSRTSKLDAQQLEFAEHVRQNVKLITDTIRDLLELGKLEAGLDEAREAVSLRETTRYAVEALRDRASARQQQLIYAEGDGPALVLGNAVRLRQVFVNLIDNALKYTPPGGSVRVEVSENAGHAVARVSDDGIGIPEEEQARVFEKFYRAEGVAKSHDGSGLGLSIARTIVEAHGGEIKLESPPGAGTTFVVTLPKHTPGEGEGSSG